MEEERLDFFSPVIFLFCLYFVPCEFINYWVGVGEETSLAKAGKVFRQPFIGLNLLMTHSGRALLLTGALCFYTLNWVLKTYYP